MAFFQAAMEQKVLCVPGVFFDVNPGKRRTAQHSQYNQHIRFSFGPPLESVELGLSRLKALVAQHRR